MTGTFEQLIIYSGMVLAFFMGLTLSSIFRLRSTGQEPSAVYRSPWYPVLPALLVAASAFVVGSSVLERPLEAFYGGATIAAGLPLYFYWKRKNAQAAR